MDRLLVATFVGCVLCSIAYFAVRTEIGFVDSRGVLLVTLLWFLILVGMFLFGFRVPPPWRHWRK